MLTEQPDKATFSPKFLSIRINLYLLKHETWTLNTLHVDYYKKKQQKQNRMAVEAWKKILLHYKSSGLLLANHLLVELKHCWLLVLVLYLQSEAPEICTMVTVHHKPRTWAREDLCQHCDGEDHLICPWIWKRPGKLFRWATYKVIYKGLNKIPL